MLALPVFAAEDVLLETQHGEVKVQLFIPAEAETVKGLLVHVFNYEMKTDDRNATFCREMSWAHINTIVSRKANNRPTKIKEAIKATLAEFAEKSGHPELVHAPRAGVGFSAGGMVTKSLSDTPELLLTNAISCSWVNEAEELGEAAKIPHFFIIGAKPDGFKMLPAIEEKFDPAIAAGLPWGLGLQHECAHDWANSGTLLMPWIRTVSELRMPENPDFSKPLTLREIDFKSGWRGDRRTIKSRYPKIGPAKGWDAPAEATVWLPNEEIAMLWRAWQVKNAPVDLAAESADGSQKLGEFKAKKSFGMSVKPGTELKLSVIPDEGVTPEKVRYFIDGEPTTEPVLKAEKVGCIAIWAEYELDGETAATNPALICVEP